MQIVGRWASHYEQATWAWYVWQINVGVRRMMGNNGGPHAKLAREIPAIEMNYNDGAFVYDTPHMAAIDRFLAAASGHYKQSKKANSEWAAEHDDRVQALYELGLNPRVGDVVAVGTPVVKAGPLGCDERYTLRQQQGGAGQEDARRR